MTKIAICYFLIGCFFNFMAIVFSYQAKHEKLQDQVIAAKKETLSALERLNQSLDREKKYLEGK